MGEIPVGELRDVGKLFHLEDESEITQNELVDLGNRKIVANLGGKWVVQLQEGKEKGIEFPNIEFEEGNWENRF